MSFSSSQSTQAFSDVSQPGRDLEELVNGLASSKADEALRVFARSHLENIRYIDVCTYPDMTPAKTLDHGILAVAQSAQTTACDIVIPILRPGTTATHLRLWFDPITDDFVTVNLSGQAPLTLWHLKSLAAVTILPQHQHRLEPSTWTVLTTAAPNENIECTALLDILLRPRNFCSSSLSLPEAPSGSKRRASTEASSSKKQKADTGALRKEAWAAAHPLFEVQDGQAVQMAGPSRDDNYNITREQHLATTPSASLYTSRLSLRPGQLIVTKALAIRPNTLIQTAENWLKEISTHRGLGPHVSYPTTCLGYRSTEWTFTEALNSRESFRTWALMLASSPYTRSTPTRHLSQATSTLHTDATAPRTPSQFSRILQTLCNSFTRLALSITISNPPISCTIRHAAQSSSISASARKPQSQPPPGVHHGTCHRSIYEDVNGALQATSLPSA